MVRVFTLPVSMTSHQILAAATPLHPITALVLPMLYRYAQNDRSLFTFLTSEEPLSFKSFLDEATIEETLCRR